LMPAEIPENNNLVYASFTAFMCFLLHFLQS
jgi:hypothetical protein